MSPTVRPHTYVALRLPSGTHKVLKIVPDTTVSLGKFGSFPSNLILGRPFYLTFEIQDKLDGELFNNLRIVPAHEIHTEATTETSHTPPESRDDLDAGASSADQFEVADEKGQVIIKNNRLTNDETSRQTLSSQEIEELKNAENSASGRDTIAKILKSHSALNEKTEFSLAKYTLRKARKYLKRFTVLPLDVNMLAKWMIEEKDPGRTLELREEMLGLIASWSNIHFSETRHVEEGGETSHQLQGRWLVIDDTGGLVIALLAERMGILDPRKREELETEDEPVGHDADQPIPGADEHALSNGHTENDQSNGPLASYSSQELSSSKSTSRPPEPMSANSNTLTLIHNAGQPNLSLLTYFNYDPNSQQAVEYPSHYHPLYTNLKLVNWLQLVSPNLDTTYSTAPSPVPDSILATWKSGKRGAYFRKRRRWERTRRVVDETREGGFDGLIVATTMNPTSVLHHTVPLLKGGAPVAVYSANIQPLLELMDAYSTERKTGYLTALGYTETFNNQQPIQEPPSVPSDDFALDPRLLLAPTLQTARAIPWQVLPGRTHPIMTSRGGAEGYLFTATRVLPVEGKISARGKFGRKRKTDDTAGVSENASKRTEHSVTN